MGYTHYHTQLSSWTGPEWQELCRGVEAIICWCYHNSVPLSHWEDEPMVTEERIAFNSANESEGYEDFYLGREYIEGLFPHGEFTKTNRKEYDIAVCLVLLHAYRVNPERLQLMSDGYWSKSEWKAARLAYQQIFGVDPEKPKLMGD